MTPEQEHESYDFADDAAVKAKPAAQAAPAPGPGDRFTAEVVQGVHVIRFTDSNLVDAFEIKELGDSIYQYLKADSSPKVVINLENVDHMSSAAIGMFIALHKVVAKQDGKLCVAHAREHLKEIFKLVRLHKLMKIHDRTDKAVASLK